MNNEIRLKVIIVGSGLAGLAAARILREHHRVTVYERGDEAVATGGQGIIIAPNAVKILESIEYDRERAGAVPIYGIRTYNKAGEMQDDVDMDLKPRFGADFDLGVQGEPANIIFNAAVVGLDPEGGVVTLNDGSTVSADVVIIADGVHSRLRSAIIGNSDYAAKKTGLTCYRIAVSTEDAKKALGDLPLPHWWKPSTCQNRSSLILAADGTARMVTAYPLRHQSYFNLSCIIRADESEKSTTESWNAGGDRGKMMEAFGDFNEPLRLILGAATEVKVWELQDLETLPTWTRGCAMLIGDAAHAMTPMQGQGANMSIEDAESLQLLAPGTRPGDVKNILKLVESFRKTRTDQIAGETRKAHTTLGLAERVNNNSELYYGYNGIQEALKARQGKTDISITKDH